MVSRISESLAGRTGFLDITPFQWRELSGRVKRFGLDTLWLRGGLPDASLAKSNPERLDWFDAYTRTFIERDLTALGIAVTPSQMRKLWTMLAHFHGFVIEHLLNAFALEIPSAQAFYWRTAKGEQVDLLIRSGKRLLPFEVKLHSVPTRNDVGGLLACMTDLGLDAGYVLHRGTANYSLVDGIEAVSTTEILSNYSLPRKL